MQVTGWIFCAVCGNTAGQAASRNVSSWSFCHSVIVLVFVVFVVLVVVCHRHISQSPPLHRNLCRKSSHVCDICPPPSPRALLPPLSIPIVRLLPPPLLPLPPSTGLRMLARVFVWFVWFVWLPGGRASAGSDIRLWRPLAVWPALWLCGTHS